jgi:2-C-methyl-D-erythritol 2,4-cyclodiphosphate synthase
MYRIGHSCDFHPLVENRDLFLGGVKIEYPLGLLGHSDADVVLHAVAESIIGALGLGDLGTHFPDSDPQYHLKESKYFVIEAMNMAKKAGFIVNNIDILIYIEKPHLKDYKPLMRSNIAKLLEVDESLVNVKAATMEKKGIIGEGVGIAAEAVVLLASNK